MKFEKQRLLDPLGMRETAFHLADGTPRSRVAEPLPEDRFGGPVAGLTDPILPRRWESGGAGMIGTIGDYARFAQMLLNGGELDGRRYLKRETVALMTSDHIGPETGIARESLLFPGRNRAASASALRCGPRQALRWRWANIAGTASAGRSSSSIPETTCSRSS